MKRRITAVVINATWHSDSTDVVTLYSREVGKLSVAVPSRGNRRRSSNPPLMPLTIIESEIRDKATEGLIRMSRFSIVEGFTRIHTDPTKIALAMFLAEFLGRLLRQQASDAKEWSVVVDSLIALEQENNPLRIANFHIVFLWHMLSATGITPDLASYQDYGVTQWLDMRKGVYTAVKPSHGDFLAPTFAKIPILLDRLNYRNSHMFRITGSERNRIVDALLHYYSVHLPGIGKINSHHILAEVFRF